MEDNIDSILTSIKKLIGPSADDTSFDTDIIIHINSALMIVLRLITVDEPNKFHINDATTQWSDLIPDELIAEAIKSFVYIKVKLVFDPPTSPTVLEALKSAADEYSWTIVQLAEQNS